MKVSSVTTFDVPGDDGVPVPMALVEFDDPAVPKRVLPLGTYQALEATSHKNPEALAAAIIGHQLTESAPADDNRELRIEGNGT